MSNIKNNEETDSLQSFSEGINLSLDSIQGSISHSKRKLLYKRLTILILFLTLSLWFSERYLRYSLTETKYRIAVSLEHESARPIMRSIAKDLTQDLRDYSNSVQNLQYLEFLASIEEGDEVLTLYASLYPHNNQNPQYLINFGCREYLNGNYEKAQKYFLEASNLVPNNSLPIYLLSSSLAKQTPPNIDFDKIISYIAKENRNNHLIIFPEPFWHPSLPTFCYGYYLRKKEIYEKILSPLYELCYSTTNYLTFANTEKNKFPSAKVKIALEELYLMGEKFLHKVSLNDSYLKSSILHLSLTIQRHVLFYYLNIKDKLKISSDILEEKKDKLDTLSNDTSLLSDLDLERQRIFEKTKNNQIFLLLIIFLTIIELSTLYFLIKFFNHYIFKPSNFETTIKNIPQILALIWGTLITTTLFFLTPNNLNSLLSNFAYSQIAKSWLLLNSLIPLLTSITQLICTIRPPKTPSYPRHIIPSFTYCLENILFYQTCNIIIGICIWFLGFRLLYQAYPYQVNLIPDIFTEKELYLVQSIIQHY